MISFRGLWLLLMLPLASACNAGDPVIGYADDDDAMNAAIEEARASTDDFLAAIRKGNADTYSVKARIAERDQAEHIWIDRVSVDDVYFNGFIANEPAGLTSVKLGDPYQIKQSDISDWMYTEGSDIYGAYTLRVMLKDMPTEQAAAFRKNLKDLSE